MVQTRQDDVWMRRGFSLLWDADTLIKVAQPFEVSTMREFHSISKSWPDELPAAHGNALVVSGLEGCMDILSPEDAAKWFEEDLKELILSFQEEYQGQAALIFWVPSGRSCISMSGASEEYYWKHATSDSKRGLHIGRLLWSGAEKEVERILDSKEDKPDYDGKAWVGLHHARIS